MNNSHRLNIVNEILPTFAVTKKLGLTVHYRNVSLRVIISLIASIAILLFGHTLDTILHAFVDPSFYLTLAASFPLTLFLVYIVHRATIWLDSQYGWRTRPITRTIFQLTVGVALPALLDLGVNLVFASVYGVTFTESTFVRIDFPVIVGFIILVNTGYVIQYLALTAPKRLLLDDGMLNTLEFPAEAHALTIAFHGSLIKLNLQKDVIYFYKLHNNVKVVTEHKTYTIKDSITELIARYSKMGFVRISRTTIVNMKYVVGSLPYPSKEKSLQVEFSIPMKEPKESIFVITANAIKPFTRALHAKDVLN